jgi:1,4-dihydroxy-2-naphthoyl-CoA synthase
MPETLATARRIADNAPLSLMQAKKSMSVATQIDRHNGYQFELEDYSRLVGTDDRLEGVRAFNEKRKADFKGRRGYLACRKRIKTTTSPFDSWSVPGAPLRRVL